MKNTFIILFIIVLLPSFKIGDNIFIDKNEEQKAYTYLNDIRTHSTKYINQFEFLQYTDISKTQLIWNDTLAKVAEMKALDMATRNYYGHIDPDGYGINYLINKSGYKLLAEWTDRKEKNSFESIVAEVKDGESAIRIFIIDNGVPSLGHRNHLLGVGKWNASLLDIGIGFARRDAGSRYKTYVSLIIAKHSW